MAQITVTVNGTQYPLACATGEEDRLRELVTYVNSKADELTSKLGKISDGRLLLMTAIMIADELQDCVAKGGHIGPLTGMAEEEVAAILNSISEEVEQVAQDITTP